MTADAFVLHQL